MKLIVGLGNPGVQYEKTRHNAGFIAVDALAESKGLGEWHLKDKFKTEVIEFTDENGNKTILAKPQTFMNLSGEAVQTLKHFYKLENSEITVVHDELDMPSGEVRKKTGGSSAGHNGVESVINHIGEDFHRVRIGIFSDQANNMEASDFVLGKLNRRELDQIRSVLIEYF